MDPANNTAAHRAALIFYAGAGRQTGPRIDFEHVRAAATGRWPALLVALGIAPEFLTRRHGPCPGCGGRDRFRFDDRGAGTWICSAGGGQPLAGDGFGLLGHAFGWSPAECLRAVADALGLTDGRELPTIPQRQTAPARQPDPADEARSRSRLNRLWSAAVPLDHTDAEPARRYLATRGLGALVDRGDLPADLRLNPACAYWHPDADGRPQRIAELPALLALVRGADGEPVGLHQTWLRADGSGKAALVAPGGSALPARKLRTARAGSSRGAAIRLWPAGPRLALGEGLETVLAVRCADPDLPVWAAISAGGVAAVAIPDPARELLLIADHDPAGARATLALARRARAEGRIVRLLVPPAGCDAADVLGGAA